MSAMLPKYCDKCGAKHDHADFEIVTSGKNKAMCKMTCKNCGNAYMIHVNSPVEGVLSSKRSAFKSEITAKEITKFSNSSKIESDEIIDIYKGLESVKTIDDFNNLIAE